MMGSPFAELETLEDLIGGLEPYAEIEVLDTVLHRGQNYPLYAISLGSSRSDAPVLAFFGGVHGLEKIGTEVICAYLQTVIELLRWDRELNARLELIRLVFFPMVNPVGVLRGTRCNGNGVDLMRNSPVRCAGDRNIYSGHRLSPSLPWYQGDPQCMETEAMALCLLVRRWLSDSPLIITLDIHSGFGVHDRLWFPYAYCKQPYPGIAEAYAFKLLFDRSYPHHFYKIEPISKQYVIDGDLWDYLYQEFRQNLLGEERHFLPLTLEMGSWLWLRKNPKHLFKRHGLFHPVLPHRKQRILRRHLVLFDFLQRCLLNPQSWACLDLDHQQDYYRQAARFWYGQ